MSRRPSTTEPSLFSAEPTTETRPVVSTPPGPVPPSKAPAPALFVVSPKITKTERWYSVAGRCFDTLEEARAWLAAGRPHPISGRRGVP